MPAPGAGATLAAAYALAWSVASTLIILLNKRVMAPPSAGGLGFAFPMTLTFLGAAFSSAAAAAALAASAVARPAGAGRGLRADGHLQTANARAARHHSPRREHA